MKKKILKVNICIGIILTLAFYILIGNVYAIEPASKSIYDGIDVSSWQGNINYEKVKKAGIEIVYIKASEGSSSKDIYFEQNYKNAKMNGLKVGFYHFLTARSEQEAVNQAIFFASVISGKKVDCKLAMDFESFGNLNVTQINKIGLAFLKKVEEITNKEVIIYSNTYNARTKFSLDMAKYPLWVAQWQVSKPSDNGKWAQWEGWQYTSKGQISGIDGNVDRDKFAQAIFFKDTSEIPKPEQSTEQTISIIIKKGDTLSKIANEYNTSVEKLVDLNNIINPNLIYAGSYLIVPYNNVIDNNQQNGVSNETIYIVKKGDTLSKIALGFRTTVQAIANRNNIKNINIIYVGQRLIIPAIGSNNYIKYKINYGDTLWSISRKYGISIAQIVKVNRIKNPNLIYAGDTLIIN